MQLWIGTSGFQYAEWKGTFYPEKLPASKMLGFYAERFATTEINYTFRRIPSAPTIERWIDGTPARFAFSLKAPQRITHFAKLRDCGDTLRFFFSVVSALSGKLGPVLFQLPPSFKKDVALLSDFVREFPGGMRAAFEFRNASWFEDDTFAALEKAGVALCIADSEKIQTPIIATAAYGYLRLRRQDYEAADIGRWADVVRQQATRWTDAYIYFKHEESGIGPKFAQHMSSELK
ncbi:MAG: DUF72 domain-containing protein [Chthoniobacterales bacterium]|nr:DUF72 domain-containing protein [Chthoniobacterales bacterium]